MAAPLDPRVLRGSRRRLILAGAIVVLEAASALLLVLSSLQVGRVLQVVVVGNDPRSALYPVELFGIFFGLRLASVQLASYVALRLGSDLADQYRRRLIDHSRSYRVAESELGYLVTDGMQSVVNYVQRLLPALVGSVTVTPILMFFVLSQGVLYFVELLVGLAVLPILMIVIGQATRDRAVEKLDATIRLNALYLDTLNGLGTLKSLNKAKLQTVSITRATSKLKRSTLSVLQIAFSSGVALDTLVSIVVAVVAVSIGIKLNDGGLTLGVGAAILFVTPEVFAPIRGAALQFHSSQDAVAVWDRIEAHVGAKDEAEVEQREIRSIEAESKVDSDLKSLEFCAFGVVVLERRLELRLTTQLELGQWLGVRGESGSGKSSFLRALVGESSSVGEAAIRLGPGTIRALTTTEIAYVPARPGFFEGTLQDNLCLYRSDATVRQVGEALKVVRLPDFEARLSQLVLPGGANFSSGERQRLALARAVLSGRDIWVLDEPTAHLNPSLEKEMLEDLKSLSETKIVVVATHSELVTHHCERVVEFSEGRCLLQR